MSSQVLGYVPSRVHVERLTLTLEIIQVTHEELFATHRTISADLESLHSRFDEQRTLNDRLENDLLRINQSAEGRGTPSPMPREDPLAGLNVGKKVGLCSPSAVTRRR
jgi:homeobox protein cut-like